ncbi:MAG TPA: hypothetical protein VGF22_04865, partial [Acidimicrobiales bacterium]
MEGDGAAELRAVGTDVTAVDQRSAAPAARDRAQAVLGRVGPPELTLGVLLLAWIITFIRLPQIRHDQYGTFGFDLGIYDQG